MAADRAIGTMTVACEASSRSHAVRLGVAATLFNRMVKGMGKTIAAICLKRHWYSEWNADGVNNVNLERVAVMADSDPVWLGCQAAYDEAAGGADPTGGATHFYDVSIPIPYWADRATFTIQIESVRFYKDVP
jgi:spore germination cell wall hydrolase CwlJ-like protein